MKVGLGGLECRLCGAIIMFFLDSQPVHTRTAMVLMALNGCLCVVLCLFITKTPNCTPELMSRMAIVLVWLSGRPRSFNAIFDQKF
jgi:hypothetical protein